MVSIAAYNHRNKVRTPLNTVLVMFMNITIKSERAVKKEMNASKISKDIKTASRDSFPIKTGFIWKFMSQAKTSVVLNLYE